MLGADNHEGERLSAKAALRRQESSADHPVAFNAEGAKERTKDMTERVASV